MRCARDTSADAVQSLVSPNGHTLTSPLGALPLLQQCCCCCCLGGWLNRDPARRDAAIKSDVANAPTVAEARIAVGDRVGGAMMKS